MKSEIVRATLSDAMYFATNMRMTADVERAGLEAGTILEDALLRADSVWVYRVDNKPIAMLGIESKSIVDDIGYLWLVTSPAIEDHAFMFVRLSKQFVREAQEYYRVLWGLVDAKFDRSIKWLRLIGFRIGPADVNGIRRFQKTRG